MIGPSSEIVEFLKQVREVFRGKIIVFTNGTFPEKLQDLLAGRLIDGAHVDMKLPYHGLGPLDDREVYEAIIGVAPSKQFLRNILESVEIVIRHNSKLSQVRTVRYPMLSEEFFEQIRIYVSRLKNKYGSNVPYFLNPFYPQPAATGIYSPMGGGQDHVSSF
ncbi:hypothetical protein [Cohnella terricola]|uniref:Radical SAM core domain-containing protein n=1 Tax=Cohnella terricola TaxID=1289167 RepID=A0A559J7T9_9BACL|nr:hypothetical protein [Cohnella terricola]TVX95955.1 hypothetical protein FPZ45_22305 [Cohnella terricola]